MHQVQSAFVLRGGNDMEHTKTYCCCYCHFTAETYTLQVWTILQNYTGKEPVKLKRLLLNENTGQFGYKQ